MSVVENLCRTYRDFKLEIPRLELADVGVTALRGPSGAGKTTIFRMLIGLEPCPGLRWEFKGEDLARLDVPARRLGVVFQSYELFPKLTARGNLEFAARARGLDKRERSARIGEFARELSIEDVLDREARVLSGGEAQRVAIARALIGRPRFLFLDEPFAALDHDRRAEARALVRRLIDREKVPTLLITHDKEDLLGLADAVVEVRAGRLV